MSHCRNQGNRLCGDLSRLSSQADGENPLVQVDERGRHGQVAASVNANPYFPAHFANKTAIGKSL
jgi:hypothetical protein